MCQLRVQQFDISFSAKHVSLASNYTKHQTVLVQLATIANFTASVDQSIMIPLLALAEATSGNVSEPFNAIREGIATAQSYITHTLPGDLKKLEIEIDHYVPDRLKDGFGCVQQGLNSLNEALESLQNGVLNAVRETGTVSMSNVELRKFVSLKVVLDVARSIRAVSVCFPSIMETVNSTIDRLKTADQFIIDTSRLIAKLNGRFSQRLMKRAASLRREFIEVNKRVVP